MGLETVSKIIRAVYYDQLAWKKLSDGFITSTHIPRSNYKELDVVHGVNVLRHFVKRANLNDQFKIYRTASQDGHIINITALPSTSEHLRENAVTGLKGIMTREHAQLSDALVTTRSCSESHLHIEFPGLSQLKGSASPEFFDTIQALVQHACWFSLSLEPSVHVRDTNRAAHLLGEQINNLGLMNPVRAQYATDITSITDKPLAVTTTAVTRSTPAKEKEGLAIILSDNNKLRK